MILKDRERAKVNSSDIKYLEKELDRCEIEKKLLINEFDLNASQILGMDIIDYLVNLEENGEKVFPNIGSRTARIGVNSKQGEYSNILTTVHKSKIKDLKKKLEYERRISEFLTSKANELKEKIKLCRNSEEMNKYRAKAFALASIAIKQFHNKENMDIREVQLLSSTAITNGDVAELGTGEGKTISIVPAAFFESLRGEGVHVITANSYLSNRDYLELFPIYNALGVSVGFVPGGIEDLARIENIDLNNITYEKRAELEKRLKETKKSAYNSDITYVSKDTVSFDYLRDGIARCASDLLQRDKTSFAIIDEIDDALIDDAESPYILGSTMITYRDNMTYMELSSLIDTPIDSLLSKIGKSINEAQSKVTFDEAREIVNVYYGRELVLNQNTYQKRCQRFFKTRIEDNIYEIKDDNEFGISKEDLYELLTDESKEAYVENDKELEEKIRKRVKEIRDNNYVIYYKETGRYHINDICYDEFLKYCYFAFSLNSLVDKNKDEILNDRNYVNGKDYNFVDDKIIMTNNGALKLVNDNNHRIFVEDYKKHANNMVPFALELSHYLNKAVSANLILKNGTDYIVKDGKVFILKDGRVQPDSSYTAGLQRAIELKEGIDIRNQRQEIESSLSITQREFYSGYECFAGLTGTSSKNIFKEVFGKNTVEIPKNAFYKFYSNRLRRIDKNVKEEPLKIIKKDTRFIYNTSDKIKLIIDSVKKSLDTVPKQPVLIALSNPEEMAILSNALLNEGIKNTCLSAYTDKRKEAEIIAKAGLSGSVTITTEMAGRGTDIKLGGDRETVIDIALERQIRNMEEKSGKKLNLSNEERLILRDRVEDALVSYKDIENRSYLWSKDEEENERKALKEIGLKVITSGYFNTNRVDRQLEGRCGRDGALGVCERFVSLADLEHIGLTEIEYGKNLTDYFKKFPRRRDTSFDIDRKSLDKINERIEMIQKNNEEIIKERIINSQEISKYSSSTVRKLIAERKDIIFDRVNMDSSITKMYENAIDYIFSMVVNEEDDISYALESTDVIDLDYLYLKVKESFGLNIDIEDIKRNKIRPLELREGILSYLMKEREKEKEQDYKGLYEKEKSALLNANSYVISNVNNAYEKALEQRSISKSVYSDYSLELKTKNTFDDEIDKIRLDAALMVVRNVKGTPLNKYEKEMERDYEDKRNGVRVVRDDERRSKITKGKGEFLEKFAKARERLNKKEEIYKIKIQKEKLETMKENVNDEMERKYRRRRAH